MRGATIHFFKALGRSLPGSHSLFPLGENQRVRLMAESAIFFLMAGKPSKTGDWAKSSSKRHQAASVSVTLLEMWLRNRGKSPMALRTGVSEEGINAGTVSISGRKSSRMPSRITRCRACGTPYRSARIRKSSKLPSSKGFPVVKEKIRYASRLFPLKSGQSARAASTGWERSETIFGKIFSPWTFAERIPATFSIMNTAGRWQARIRKYCLYSVCFVSLSNTFKVSSREPLCFFWSPPIDCDRPAREYAWHGGSPMIIQSFSLPSAFLMRLSNSTAAYPSPWHF